MNLGITISFPVIHGFQKDADNNLLTRSRRRRRRRRRNKARPSRMGPRHPHQRNQHGPHVPARHPRDAQVRPRRDSEHFVRERDARRQPELALRHDQGCHHPDDEGHGGAPRDGGHTRELRGSRYGVYSHGEESWRRDDGGNEAGED